MVIGEPRFAQRHDTFDFMTDKEFHEAFMRISYYVDFKGDRTPQDIEESIVEEVRTLKFFGDRGYWRPETAYNRASNLKKIEGTSFTTRTIATARRHPDGFINLVLNFGRVKAMDVVIERNIRLRRMMRMRR